MRWHHSVFLLMPLAAGLFAYLGFRILLGENAEGTVQAGKTSPIVVFPSQLEMGAHEIGSIATARFTMANEGSENLVVDSIVTSCACTGIEREENGKFVAVRSLRLSAGEKADLAVRIRVQGVAAGAAFGVAINFRTNDPERPNCQIKAVVSQATGGIQTAPSAVVMGTRMVGEDVRDVVDVYDSALVSRTIERIASSDPERVAVRLLPSSGSKSKANVDQGGALIGQIEVLVKTQTPGEVYSEVQIYLAGNERKPDVMSVRGRVVPIVEILPSQLVLPLASGEGPVYTGQVVFRRVNGKQLKLAVKTVPVGLKAQIVVVPGNPAALKVAVTWDGKQSGGSVGVRRRVVVLDATVDDREIQLELPVVCQEKRQ